MCFVEFSIICVAQFIGDFKFRFSYLVVGSIKFSIIWPLNLRNFNFKKQNLKNSFLFFSFHFLFHFFVIPSHVSLIFCATKIGRRIISYLRLFFLAKSLSAYPAHTLVILNFLERWSFSELIFFGSLPSVQVFFGKTFEVSYI